MDSLFGVSRQIIDRAGKSENTLTIFTSEQGAALPFAKWTCYEQGLKTGFIISWENHIRNGRSKALTQYVDVVPTLLDLVGASNEMSSLDRAFDGISFLDVIQGNEVSKRKYIYGVQTSRGISNGPESYPIRSVSDGTFKLIHNLESETTFTNNLTVKNWSYAESNSHENVVRYQNRPEYEFYNLKIDPFEQDNLINNTVYLNKITELKQSLSTWMISQNDFGVETELKALNRMNY